MKFHNIYITFYKMPINRGTSHASNYTQHKHLISTKITTQNSYKIIKVFFRLYKIIHGILHPRQIQILFKIIKVVGNTSLSG